MTKFSTINIEGKRTKGNYMCLDCCSLFRTGRQRKRHKCPSLFRQLREKIDKENEECVRRTHLGD